MGSGASRKKSSLGPKVIVPGVRARSPLPREDAKKRNQEIEKSLQVTKAADGRTVKLLLLGTNLFIFCLVFMFYVQYWFL